MADDQYKAQEATKRLQKIMQGAFSGPPTPLKGIPKRNGESRAGAKKARGPASAKNARPKP